MSSTTDPKPTFSTQPIDSADDEVKVTGEKRKAPSPAPAEGGTSNEGQEEAGGKDKVEKKQTTLDNVVQHEAGAEAEVKKNQEEEKEGKAEEERPAKKTKLVEVEVEVDAEDAATPPAQLSQPSTTSTAAETPHKTLKKVDNLADKPVDATPSKSLGTAGTVGAGTTSDPPTSDDNGNGNTTATSPAGEDTTVPGDEAHLDHPENWTTGADPATDKQKGFLKVLEKQKGVSVGDVSGIGKSEASEKIDELKNM